MPVSLAVGALLLKRLSLLLVLVPQSPSAPDAPSDLLRRDHSIVFTLDSTDADFAALDKKPDVAIVAWQGSGNGIRPPRIQITRPRLAHIAALPRLHTLELSEGEFAPGAAPELARFRNLNVLRLMNMKLTDADL